MKNKKSSVKLIDRIKKELSDIHIEDSAEYQRLYPGHIQRFNGAWSWHLINNGPAGVGSQWPVSELLNAEKIDFAFHAGDYSIFPVD